MANKPAMTAAWCCQWKWAAAAVFVASGSAARVMSVAAIRTDLIRDWTVSAADSRHSCDSTFVECCNLEKNIEGNFNFRISTIQRLFKSNKSIVDLKDNPNDLLGNWQ